MNSKKDDGERCGSEQRRCKFPAWRRLRSSRDFETIFAGKMKAGDQWLLVFGRTNESGMTRIGLSVSRKHGNSIVRHRLRRLLREAYRLEQHSVPEGLDLILIPSRDSARATLADYRQSVVALSRRLARKLSPSKSPDVMNRPSEGAHQGDPDQRKLPSSAATAPANPNQGSP